MQIGLLRADTCMNMETSVCAILGRGLQHGLNARWCQQSIDGVWTAMNSGVYRLYAILERSTQVHGALILYTL
jgi:hypothetical protein